MFLNNVSLPPVSGSAALREWLRRNDERSVPCFDATFGGAGREGTINTGTHRPGTDRSRVNESQNNAQGQYIRGKLRHIPYSRWAVYNKHPDKEPNFKFTGL